MDNTLTKKKYTFHIITYGCQMNYADSARIKAICTRMGFEYVENIDNADIVIFDTCSVKQKSEDKVHGKLRNLLPHQKARLTGCMIQHNVKNTSGKLSQHKYGNFLGRSLTDQSNKEHTIDDVQIIGTTPDDMKPDTATKSIVINHAFNPFFRKVQSTNPCVELFFRIDDVAYLPLIAQHLGYQVNQNIDFGPNYLAIYANAANKNHLAKSKTIYIPIQTGCNQFCSYCIVPYARGLENNRPYQEILDEVDYHIAQGVQEIVFLGQIVNKHPDFIKILRSTAKKKAVKWIRYTSPYPTFYSDELLHLHETEAKLCPHIHIPVQSGSTQILKKMFRGYTREQFIEFVDKIRSIQRSISLTSDVIVGFPNETEEDFLQTLSLAEYASFDMIYMSIYSPRPGTYAARALHDTVPQTEKKQRRARLNETLTGISAVNNKIDIGKTYDIMITETRGYGYVDHMKNVEIVDSGSNTTSYNVGTFRKVRITDAISLKLYGELLPV